MSGKKLLDEEAKRRIQSSQAKNGRNMGSDGFAAKVQSVVDKRNAQNKEQK